MTLRVRQRRAKRLPVLAAAGARPSTTLNRPTAEPTTEPMDRGLYVAASGMLTEQARQDQLANDLANVTTAGYKADRVSQSSFGELLLSNRRDGSTVGQAGLGVKLDRQYTDLRPQALKETDEPLDLAVAGEGYFAVRTASGIRYTRNGAFQAASNGTLVDQLGNAVLTKSRQPVKLQADGTVKASDVGLFAVPNARKQGDANFTGTARGAGAGEVRTGQLETSGVDSTRVLIDMMASLRAFEASQRAVTTIDESLKSAAQRVGSTSS